MLAMAIAGSRDRIEPCQKSISTNIDVASEGGCYAPWPMAAAAVEALHQGWADTLQKTGIRNLRILNAV